LLPTKTIPILKLTGLQFSEIKIVFNLNDNAIGCSIYDVNQNYMQYVVPNENLLSDFLYPSFCGSVDMSIF